MDTAKWSVTATPHLPTDRRTVCYAQLIASKLPEITAVDPLLTLEGLRLVWQGSQ
jgi:hypothetical protein